MKAILNILTAASILATVGPTAAHAQILGYTTRDLFEAAITGETTQDFESLVIPASPGYVSIAGGADITLGDITTVNGNVQYELGAGGAFGPGTGSQYIAEDSTGTTTIENTAGVTALGFDTITDYGSTGTVSATVTDSLGHTLTFASPVQAASGSPSLTFVGFTDLYAGATITSITYVGPIDFDNVSSGEAITVPEPTPTALILMSGLALLLGGMRLRWQS